MPKTIPNKRVMPSADRSRLCPFHGCTRRISPDYFACGAHWNSLTSIQRVDIHAAYEQWQRGEIDGEELRRRQQAVLGELGDATKGD